MIHLEKYIQSNLNCFGGFPDKVKQEIESGLRFRKASISGFVNQCETPIEQLLAVHLIDLEFHLYKELSVLGKFKSLHILAQKEVVVNDRKYRLDFLIECITTTKHHKYAIECDGHEFHEKTKGQAARDKARERNLMSEGYKVIRFTGSEIWKNASRCSGEIINIIQNDVGLDDYYNKLLGEG